MTSLMSPSSVSTSSNPSVYLRKDHNSGVSFRRPLTVRSLVLSEMFFPLENNSSSASPQSAVLRSRSACRSCVVTDTAPEVSSSPLPPQPPSSRKKTPFSTLHRSDSLLSRLHALFGLKRPTTPHPKHQQQSAVAHENPPKIRAPLGRGYDNLRPARSQSSASHRRTSRKPVSAQASPARSVDNEPLVSSFPSPKLPSASAITSFLPQSALPPPQRPQNLPLAQHLRSHDPVAQQKHYSAHLPSDVLRGTGVHSQSSSGLWSASSVTSLGASMHRSATVRPAGDLVQNHRDRRRSPSASLSSADSAVDLVPTNPSTDRQGTLADSSCHYSSVYHLSASSSPYSSRLYEDFSPTGCLADTTTPTASQPPPPLPAHSGFSGCRSASTTTLTSAENEPTYAVVSGAEAACVSRLPPPPPVPPRVSATPLLLTADPQPPSFLREEVSERSQYHRRAASALRFGDLGGQHQRRPASTISSATTSGASNTSWYAEFLPYKPSTLPEDLADRLRQRDSFLLSGGGDLMTRSMCESRPQTTSASRYLNRRSASRTRPVSFHDAPTGEEVRLPSLEHLMKASESWKTLPPQSTTTPVKKFAALSVQETLAVQPTDSPLLGQYCRLKFVIPQTATTKQVPNNGPCSTFR